MLCGALNISRTDWAYEPQDAFPLLAPHLADQSRRSQAPGPIRKITKLSFAPDLLLRDRQLVSRQQAAALIECGLLTGIDAYTIVLELAWTGHPKTMG